MRVKCCNNKILTRKRVFLLLIAPLLIGFMITFMSLAKAEWHQKSDPLLFQSPKKQGWVLMGVEGKPSDLLKGQKEVIKRASR